MVKIWNLGLTSYDTALKIQVALARKHLDAVKKGSDSKIYDTVLLAEHKPVYTVGKKEPITTENLTYGFHHQ